MAAHSANALTLTVTTDTEVVGTRVFDAPRELVFRAYTDPELIPRWWSPRRYTTAVDTMDVRVGGTWRFRTLDAAGNEVATFSGEYREVAPPERIVQTSNFELIGPGHEVLETVTFEALDGGRTQMTTTMQFLSKQDRDGMLQSGMESGYSESLGLLDEVLEGLRSAA